MTLLTCFPLERFSFHLCRVLPPQSPARLPHRLFIVNHSKQTNNGSQAQSWQQREAEAAPAKYTGFRGSEKPIPPPHSASTEAQKTRPVAQRSSACHACRSPGCSPVSHPNVRKDSEFNHVGPRRTQRAVFSDTQPSWKRLCRAEQPSKQKKTKQKYNKINESSVRVYNYDSSSRVQTV